MWTHRWGQVSRSTVAEYRDLPRGSYEFIVQAIDPFCQYSDPIAVEVLVAVTPTQILHWVLLVTITITACVSIVIASAKHRKLRRTEQRLLEEATNELQKAHSLQMGLMPKQSPEIPGFSVYGTCRPAKEVGGDFYQYKTRNDSVLFTVADVTGHAMEAAIPAVMFSGLLEGATFEEITTEQLAHDLNTTLHDKLDRRTFVCFVAGKLDTSSKTLQICDCGCPYPYHFIAKTGELQELQMDAYPLGVSASTEYTSRLLRLEVDDYVVFCTDGIIETRNPRGEEMGFARVSELLQDSCRRGMPPADLVEHLIAQSDAFSKGAEQEDDITCVALKVDL